MWKDNAACQFLGGKLTYQTTQVCKTGKPHTWARVTRCVQGPILTHKGLDYKTGNLTKAANATTDAKAVKKDVVKAVKTTAAKVTKAVEKK